MDTLEAFEKDVLLQVVFLKKFVPQTALSEKQQKKTFFCGSGDSFAAALLAESFSNFKVRAIDPLDLAKNQVSKNDFVYFISISGNTIANINAAKVTKNSIAITANPKSKLTSVCNQIILLDFPNSGIFTSGSIGFLTSALTCISLVQNLRLSEIEPLFKRAFSFCEQILLDGKVYILGNMHTYPIAMYMAAKFYEILGSEAYYERIEQFLHMGLFSAKAGDTVIILEEKNSHNTKLEKILKKTGLNIIHPLPQTEDKVEQTLFFTFVAQLLPLYHAKKNHQKDCYFVTAEKIRHASSEMIY